MSRGANLLANLTVNPGVSDLTGSFRLYKRDVLVDLVTAVKGRAYVFQMEVSWDVIIYVALLAVSAVLCLLFESYITVTDAACRLLCAPRPRAIP